MAFVTLHSFGDTSSLDKALAASVARNLQTGLCTNGQATLAVSGGRTPAGFFQALAQTDLDWSRILVTLVDERCVGEDSPFSNAAGVKRNLLIGAARQACFVPLFLPDEEFPLALSRLSVLPARFDAVILGMGEDGHTASIFPDSPQREAALHGTGAEPALRTRGKDPVPERITLTAARILATQHLYLHITGMAKWQVLGQALACSADHLPVSHFLHSGESEHHVFWAP